MSESAAREADRSERESLLRLEAAVGQLLDAWELSESRLREAERRLVETEERLRAATERVAELEGVLDHSGDGVSEVAALVERVARLEVENGELRERLGEASRGVDRLLARLRFLQDQGAGADPQGGRG